MTETAHGLQLENQESDGTSPNCPLVNFEQLELELDWD